MIPVNIHKHGDEIECGGGGRDSRYRFHLILFYSVPVKLILSDMMDFNRFLGYERDIGMEVEPVPKIRDFLIKIGLPASLFSF